MEQNSYLSRHRKSSDFEDKFDEINAIIQQTDDIITNNQGSDYVSKIILQPEPSVHKQKNSRKDLIHFLEIYK
ncbi:MAG: hypothetical protein FK734_01205 [Asgard group archaeon]|nr:hypothetical protein [Asgard group archaeon]